MKQRTFKTIALSAILAVIGVLGACQSKPAEKTAVPVKIAAVELKATTSLYARLSAIIASRIPTAVMT